MDNNAREQLEVINQQIKKLLGIYRDIVSHMVKKELAFLEVVPGTRNRKIIRLTEEGKKYGESIVRTVSEAENRAFDRLPNEDKLACTVAFGKYINILKEEIYGTENE